MFYFHPEPWGDDSIWRAYFSNGLVQPPTRVKSSNRDPCNYGYTCLLIHHLKSFIVVCTYTPCPTEIPKKSLFESMQRLYIYLHEYLIFNGKCRFEYVRSCFFKLIYLCIILHLGGFHGIFTYMFYEFVGIRLGSGIFRSPPKGNWPWGLAAMATASVEAKRCSSRCIEKYPWLFRGDLGVSENSGTPKSSILMGFSIININHPFWGTSFFGNTHLLGMKSYPPGTKLTSVFEGQPPPKQGRTSNKNKGPHLGSRQLYRDYNKPI